MTEKELEELYTQAYKAVYWTALNLLKDEDEAEDVVQDTFISAYEHYDTLQDKTKAVAWVKKIAANKCLNILTRKKTVNADDEFFEDVEAIGDDFLPESMIESAEKRKIIMDIIHNSLSEETAMTIILFYFNEMSVKEIAERLNIPQGTVLSRMNYAKKKIKKEVEKYEKENKDKLFMGIPFLTMLFEKEAEQIPFKPMPVSLRNLAASAQATTEAAAATAATAASAAKTVSTVVIVRNIVIAVAASLVIGGTGFFAYKKIISHKDVPESTSNVTETVETKEESQKNINVQGMTPDQLDLTGGYVRYSKYHDYSTGEESDKNQLYYDADGKLVLDCLYNENGQVIHSDYFTYDANGNVIREELWDASTDTLGTCKVYTYGPKGIERVDSGYFNKDAEEYYEYEYDEQDRLIKVSEYKIKAGACYWFCDYTYEEDGSYTKQVTSFDVLSQKMKQSKDYNCYSADGRLIKEYKSFSNENTLYTYDENGTLTLAENYHGKKLNHTTTYEYDAKGRLVRESTSSTDGKQWWDYSYEYENL
ncbi:MAG: sigma-70 family RNA polymerase sigma factor [Clostridiales bacterium]|nr:sigma-70 family RNA polymerase sigma factor [Clostridiales bacterium]